MKTKAAVIISMLALLTVAVGILGDGGQPASAAPGANERALGSLVDKDSAKQHPAAAVARAKLTEFGRVSWQITSKPSGLSVENAFAVRCQKGFLIDYFPGPGDLKTTKRKTPFSGSYTIPLADPDLCDFQVAGLIPGESDRRGTVTVKIFDKG